jgi:hypothetical protein
MALKHLRLSRRNSRVPAYDSSRPILIRFADLPTRKCSHFTIEPDSDGCKAIARNFIGVLKREEAALWAPIRTGNATGGSKRLYATISQLLRLAALILRQRVDEA